MKHNWEYKKLGEVCESILDGDWIESKDQSDMGIRLIQTGNIGNGIFLNKESRSKFITDTTFKELKCTEIFPGDILVSRLPDPIGRACIVPSINNRMITAVDCTIIRTGEKVLPQYFIHYSKSNKYHYFIDSFIRGTTRKRISRKNLENIKIPTPAKVIQEKIIKELDEINDMMEGRKEQLRLLDQLAQSIFYDMFGDPITNPKGWEIKKLGDILIIERGGSPRPINDYLTDDLTGVNWIKIGDTNSSMYVTSTKEKIRQEGIKKSRFVEPGDFILSNSMSFGRPYIMATSGCIHDGWLLLRDTKNIFNKIFLYNCLKSETIYREFERIVRTGTVSNLNSEIVRGVKVPIPPISLQNEFASKVEIIEEQKKDIETSIKELETLLASRMDYWFN